MRNYMISISLALVFVGLAGCSDPTATEETVSKHSIIASGSLGEWSLIRYGRGANARLSGGTIEDFEFWLSFGEALAIACTVGVDDLGTLPDPEVLMLLDILDERSREDGFQINYMSRRVDQGRFNQVQVEETEESVTFSIKGDEWECTRTVSNFFTDTEH